MPETRREIIAEIWSDLSDDICDHYGSDENGPINFLKCVIMVVLTHAFLVIVVFAITLYLIGHYLRHKIFWSWKKWVRIDENKLPELEQKWAESVQKNRNGPKGVHVEVPNVEDVYKEYNVKYDEFEEKLYFRRKYDYFKFSLKYNDAITESVKL